MALTDFSDLFSSINEAAINNVVVQMQKQRPSLFNYGTQMFIQRPEMLCSHITNFVDVDVFNFGNPLIHKLELLRVPGYTGMYGLEYCFQLSELSIDFFPTNIHSLPPELNPMPEQHFSIKTKLCVGLGCPDQRLLDKLAPNERPFFPIVDIPGVSQPYRPRDEQHDKENRDDKPVAPPDHPIPFEKPLCCCLDLFAVLHLQRGGVINNPLIALKLDNLEIVDVKPKCLEDIAECYLKTMMVFGFLPKIKLALRALIFNIADVLTVEPTPAPGGVPNNPAIEDDQVKVFISLTV